MKTITNIVRIYVVLLLLILGGICICVGLYSFITWDWVVMGNVFHWFNPATNIFVRIILLVLFALVLFFYWIVNELWN